MRQIYAANTPWPRLPFTQLHACCDLNACSLRRPELDRVYNFRITGADQGAIVGTDASAEVRIVANDHPFGAFELDQSTARVELVSNTERKLVVVVRRSIGMRGDASVTVTAEYVTAPSTRRVTGLLMYYYVDASEHSIQ